MCKTSSANIFKNWKAIIVFHSLVNDIFCRVKEEELTEQQRVKQTPWRLWMFTIFLGKDYFLQALKQKTLKLLYEGGKLPLSLSEQDMSGSKWLFTLK